eukprot:gene17734-biopygen2351
MPAPRACQCPVPPGRHGSPRLKNESRVEPVPRQSCGFQYVCSQDSITRNCLESPGGYSFAKMTQKSTAQRQSIPIYLHVPPKVLCPSLATIPIDTRTRRLPSFCFVKMCVGTTETCGDYGGNKFCGICGAITEKLRGSVGNCWSRRKLRNSAGIAEIVERCEGMRGMLTLGDHGGKSKRRVGIAVGKASGGLGLTPGNQVVGWNWRRESKWRVGPGVASGRATGIATRLHSRDSYPGASGRCQKGPAVAVTDIQGVPDDVRRAPP